MPNTKKITRLYCEKHITFNSVYLIYFMQKALEVLSEFC